MFLAKPKDKVTHGLFQLILWSVFVLSGSCVKPDTRFEETLFTSLDSSQTKIGFINHLSDTGNMNILDYLYYYNGAGVAVGDVNNDGYADLYFVSNQGGNKLYINEGKEGKFFSFKDVSVKAGVGGLADWQTGVTMVDINGDGWLDIYVCAVGSFKELKGCNELYINNGLNENGDVTFTEEAAEYGLDLCGFSTQAVFFDYDKDGDLDMFLLNHAVHTSRSYDLASTRIIADRHAGDYFFENQLVNHSSSGENTKRFKDVSAKAGIYQASMGYGLGVVVADLNNDGWDDIYVANDFHEDDYYYINNQDGTFTESLRTHFGHVSRFSMGCDAADINNDGYLDLITLDMYSDDETIEKSSAGEDPFDIFLFKLQYGYYNQYSRNALQINQGGKAFSDVGVMAGVAATDWSWSPLIADYDNDGIKDIFISNGIVRRPNDLDYIKFISNNAQRWTQQNARMLDQEAIGRMPQGKVHNYIFKGTGGIRFEDKSDNWGFNSATISNGAVYADLDNDGDLDIVTNNINEPAGIYQNNSEKFFNHAFLKIKFHGDGKNTSGIGAKVFLKHRGKVQFQQVMLTRGFLSSIEPVLNFGLGSISSVDTLIVMWGNGKAEIKTNLRINTVVELFQSEAIEDSGYYYRLLFDSPSTLFTEITEDYGVDYVHNENVYYDFDKEPLIPFLVSTEGPRLAVGDVNGDGLDDFYVGGARHQSGKLFIQKPGNSFTCVDQVFKTDSAFEDVDAVFFDADGDGDLDLYVVSGGNEFYGADPLLSDRLYINDGKGNFHRDLDALPVMSDNKSCVKPCDFDNDGDNDLFVGGRVVTGLYGDIPDSYLLINDGKGNFTDQTDHLAPGLRKVGMITDAHWFDWDNDGRNDLIVVGDWMPVRIFKNDFYKMVEVKSIDGLEQSNGFWQTIHAGDFDKDGDIDFFIGNLGTNSKLRKPAIPELRLYIKDIDGNGSPDHILAYPIGKDWYVAASKDELSKQLPLIRKKFTDYESFAGKSVEQIFDKRELKDARVLSVNRFESIYLENLGNSKFKQHLLPDEVQVSKIFTFLSEDLSGDGNDDILFGGNFYGASMYQGRYDASYGGMLKNNGQSEFHLISSNTSGLLLRGEVRDIKSLRTADGKIILVARNNLPLQIFKKNDPPFKSPEL